MVLLAMLALGAGCQNGAKTNVAVPPKPPVMTSRSYYMGTPLSGPTAESVPSRESAANAWAVEVTIVSLDRVPAAGDSLGNKATFLTMARGASVVLPSSRLTRGARYAPPGDAAAVSAMRGGAVVKLSKGAGHSTELLARASGVVPPGATAAFKVAEPVPHEDHAAGRIWWRGVEVDVFRQAPQTDEHAAPGPTTAPASNAVQVALAVDDFAQPDRVDSSADTPAAMAAPSPQRELAIVDVSPQAGAQTLAFAVPFRFQGVSGQAVAAIVTIAPAPRGIADQELWTSCVSELEDSRRIAALPPQVAGHEESALHAALTALYKIDRRRAALTYLSELTGASLSGDAALVSDDHTLALVAGKVFKDQSIDHPQAAAIGWLLDRTWLLEMSEQIAGAKLAPELSAVLATHAGEVGRHQSSIEAVVRAAHSHADYEALLVEENKNFLEDSSPSARARAFDWLQVKGKAPGGYDPLGDDKQRRNALERALLGLPPLTTAPPTQPATEPTTAPTTEPKRTPSQEAP
jgi:hypothetical protein